MNKSHYRSIPSKLLAFVLNSSSIRRRLLFHIKQYFYNELKINFGIGRGLTCPIADPSATCSLQEIFFENEYLTAFQNLSLPDKWLDLGCHFGYFSLYVAWLHSADESKNKSFKAFLLDADSRVRIGVSELIIINKLDENFTFVHGAISEGTGSVSFKENLVMSSSLSDLDNSSNGNLVNVPIIDQYYIMDCLSPPYDLVKIDVEGAEYDFLVAYKEILAVTTTLIIEWHSWHRGGGSELGIQNLVQSYGFILRKVIQPPKNCGTSSQDQVGVLLFSK